MKNTIKLTEKIPFTQSFISKVAKKGLTCKTVTRNLGATFYPRLIAIYNNLIESFVVNNNYLKTAAIPQLATQLTRKRDYVRLQGLKMKINDPPKKLLGLNNYILPQTVYRNDNFYISVVCRVYFGGKFNPFGEYSWAASERVIKVGKYRYLVWNKQKSFGQNLSNIFSQQIYQFVVKVQSNYYINLFNTQSTDTYRPEKIEVRYDQDEFQDMVATEIVLRSSSQHFDWVLYDLNGILSNKYKK